MKGKLLFILVLFTTFLFAQTKTLYFTYPTNGAVISIPEGQSTVNVTIQYSYTSNLATNEIHKLHADQTYTSDIYPYNLVSSPPVTCNLAAGAYTWRLERYLWIPGLGAQPYGTPDTITFAVRPSVTVRTSFSGGTLLVNSIERSNGYNFTPEPNSTTYLSVNNQQYGDYFRVFTNWTGVGGTSTTRDNYINSPSTYSATATATMPKQCSLTFQNSYGSMYVAGGTYSSSATVGVVEQTSITAYGNTYVNNGIEYRFTNWTKEGSTYGQTITPSAHGTYTANYDNGRPEYVNFYFGTVLNAPIKVLWTDNPNTAVTFYNIYRREKINGVFTDPVQIATVNRGVGYYNDADYTLAYAKNGIWLEYSVEAYYSTVGSYSDHGWLIAYGNIGASMQNNDLALAKTESEVPVEFAISNYPNPFNPTTTINYQLPKDGMVTIKVYDVLGKEVATLVNEQKSAGYYKVDFDARHLERSREITSGVYICSIQASSFNKSIKLLLTK